MTITSKYNIGDTLYYVDIRENEEIVIYDVLIEEIVICNDKTITYYSEYNDYSEDKLLTLDDALDKVRSILMIRYANSFVESDNNE